MAWDVVPTCAPQHSFSAVLDCSSAGLIINSFRAFMEAGHGNMGGTGMVGALGASCNPCLAWHSFCPCLISQLTQGFRGQC